MAVTSLFVVVSAIETFLFHVPRFLRFCKTRLEPLGDLCKILGVLRLKLCFTPSAQRSTLKLPTLFKTTVPISNTAARIHSQRRGAQLDLNRG